MPRIGVIPMPPATSRYSRAAVLQLEVALRLRDRDGRACLQRANPDRATAAVVDLLDGDSVGAVDRALADQRVGADVRQAVDVDGDIEVAAGRIRQHPDGWLNLDHPDVAGDVPDRADTRLAEVPPGRRGELACRDHSHPVLRAQLTPRRSASASVASTRVEVPSWPLASPADAR